MKIDHLGILVDDIDTSKKVFEHLGLDVGIVESVPEFGADIAFIGVGGSLIELVEPVDEESELVSGLKTADHSALLHHVAFRVADIESRLAELRDAGVPLADEPPRQGAGEALVAFLDRRAAEGVRIELVERDADIEMQ